MKKITSILTALTMAAALLAGCGAGTPAQTSSGAAGEGGDAKSVVVVFPQGLGDAGPMDAMNENLKKAQEDFGIEASVFSIFAYLVFTALAVVLIRKKEGEDNVPESRV